LIRYLQQKSGLEEQSSPKVIQVFAAGGFLARGTQSNEPDTPACVFGYADLIIYSSREEEPHIAATGEFKIRPQLKEGKNEPFGRHDALACQNWVSGIGSGCKRFFSMSNNGFKLFWLTKDESFEPSEDGPQERFIIEMFPPGPDMASFSEYENCQVFIRFLHGLARASGMLHRASSDPDYSDSPSGDDSSDEFDSGGESDDADSSEENSGDNNVPETVKRQRTSQSVGKTTKFVTQELKHKRGPSEPITKTLIKGGMRSADMTVIRVNIDFLEDKIQEALVRIGRELVQEKKEMFENEFEEDLIV